MGIRRGRGSIIPAINRATAQPVVAEQLLRRGQDLAVIWQRISNHEPSRPTLAIFQVPEETGVKCICNAP
jgi:hypothetical protein